MRPTLHIVDGSYYIYRAYYAIRGLSNSQGFPTNALYGFMLMLQKLIVDAKATHLLVTFDPGGPSFRSELYPEYKANRDKMPEDLIPQLPHFRHLVRAYNIPVFELEGFEADDVIGTLVQQVKAVDFDVVLVTGDKDLTQLVSERVTCWDTMRDKRVGLAEVQERFGIGPHGVPDILGLMGDSSDNIPGVPGIGEKTAIKLISKYGSIEGIYDHIDELKGKQKERLLENRDKAELSRILATIRLDLDLEFDAAAAKLGEPDPSALAHLFREFEFTKQLGELEKKYGQQIDPDAHLDEAPPKEYQLVTNLEVLDKVVKAVRRAKRVCVDLELSERDSMRTRIVGVSLAWKAHAAVYIPIALHERLKQGRLTFDEVFKKLGPLLADPKIAKVGQDTKEDWLVLAEHGVAFEGVDFDTMLASYVLDPSREKHTFDVLTREVLKLKRLKVRENPAYAPRQGLLDFGDVDLGTHEAAEVADLTFLLWEALSEALSEQPELGKLYYDLELPLARILAEMERVGILVDRDQLRRLSVEFQAGMDEAEKGIYEAAGTTFKINSPKQLAKILFEDLGLPVVKKTKTGPSTDASVLETLKEQHALPKLILQHRALSKLKSTYTDALPLLIHPRTGRIHSHFAQTVAATGRLSSNNPNLQNIPVRTPGGRRIREAFVAPPGRILFSADYSQVELRILAHMSDDPVLVDAFNQGQDIHARTASELFDVAPDQIDKGQRSLAKTINFGVLYGMGPVRLSRELGISRAEAKAFIVRYFDRMGGVKAFLETMVEDAKSKGYAETLLGRRRPLPELKSRNRAIFALGERLAVNTPIQGTAADIIKRAMVMVHEQLGSSNIDALMLLQVHDELVFEVDWTQLEELQSLVIEQMSTAVTLRVPLVVDVSDGSNWAKL